MSWEHVPDLRTDEEKRASPWNDVWANEPKNGVTITDIDLPFDAWLMVAFKATFAFVIAGAVIGGPIAFLMWKLLS